MDPRSKEESGCLLGTLRQELFRPEQEGVLELGVVPGWRSSKCYQGVGLQSTSLPCLLPGQLYRERHS